MCGVSGFFVGCDMAGKCGREGTSACSLIRGSDTLINWHDKASVRKSPRRMLTELDIDQHIYPRSLAPVLNHEIVRKLDGEQITGILNNHLFRYLDFTAKLEIYVVNDVMADLAFGQTPIKFDEKMHVDALKIYTDEGYHALFSKDLFNQAKALLEVAPIVPEKPRFMKSLHNMLADCESERERSLTKLFFVATSETLITSSLAEIRKAGDVPDAISQTINDHALDEARHHAFFKDVIQQTLPTLEQHDRENLLRRFPDYIFAFVNPDTEAIGAELVSNGLSRSQAGQVVAETYTDRVMQKHARSCASSLMRVLKQVPEFSRDEYQQIYTERGLL